MESGQEVIGRTPQLSIRTLHKLSPFAELARDVSTGLTQTPKQLPPKYFYDEQGSDLFDRICNTPEYYPTRTESALLATHARDVIHRTRPDVIVELGSGASRKTTHLLDACEDLDCLAKYQPVDICREIVESSGERLLAHYHWLEIEAVVTDYNRGLHHFADAEEHRLFVFLGGTLGNFTESEALEFLIGLRQVFHDNDRLLLGVDRVKHADVLNDAYNDANGLTAAFNQNVLTVINRELEGDFDLSRFEHHAWFNEDHSRIEMHLRSTVDQDVTIGDLGMMVSFRAGETILTEISRKFTPEGLEGLLHQAGFSLEAHYEPDNGFFSLVLARPA